MVLGTARSEANLLHPSHDQQPQPPFIQCRVARAQAGLRQAEEKRAGRKKAILWPAEQTQYDEYGDLTPIAHIFQRMLHTHGCVRSSAAPYASDEAIQSCIVAFLVSPVRFSTTMQILPKPYCRSRKRSLIVVLAIVMQSLALVRDSRGRCHLKHARSRQQQESCHFQSVIGNTCSRAGSLANLPIFLKGSREKSFPATKWIPIFYIHTRSVHKCARTHTHTYAVSTFMCIA